MPILNLSGHRKNNFGELSNFLGCIVPEGYALVCDGLRARHHDRTFRDSVQNDRIFQSLSGLARHLRSFNKSPTFCNGSFYTHLVHGLIEFDGQHLKIATITVSIASFGIEAARRLNLVIACYGGERLLCFKF
jgi:hypothetical protein